MFADRFAQVTELLGDDDTFTTLLQNLIRESSARGIFFIVSAMRTGEIPYKIRDCFKGIGLQINDRADYTEIVGKRVPSDMPDIASFPGRGLAQIDDSLYEIQIALSTESASDVERATDIVRAARAQNAQWDGVRPGRIPRVPEHPVLADLESTEACKNALEDAWSFVFAYNASTGLPEEIRLDSSFSFLITGGRQTGKTNLLMLIAQLWSRRGAKICVAADASWDVLCRQIGASRYENYKEKDWENCVSWLNNEIKLRNQQRKQAQTSGTAALNALVRIMEPIVILADDLERFVAGNLDVVKGLFAEVASVAAKYGIYFFASVSHNAYSQIRMQEPLASLARQQRGIALCGKLNECAPWGVSMPFSQKSVALPVGEGYLVNNGAVMRIVIPKAEIQET